MKIDKEHILKNLIRNNEQIRNNVKKEKPTKQELIDNILVLMEMDEEIKKGHEINYSTYFKVINKKIVRFIKKHKRAKENLISQNINPIKFDTKKDMYWDGNRNEVMNYVKHQFKLPYASQKGLYLHGQMGFGKTFLFKKFVLALIKHNYSVAFINVSRFQNYIYSCIDTEKNYKQELHKLSQCDYLFVDDIGSETINSFFRDNILLVILNNRMEDKKVTFLNSNYSYAQLLQYQQKNKKDREEQVMQAKRLLERIKALTFSIQLTGKNQRYK